MNFSLGASSSSSMEMLPHVSFQTGLQLPSHGSVHEGDRSLSSFNFAANAAMSFVYATVQSNISHLVASDGSHRREIDRLVEVSYFMRTVMAVIYFVTAILAFIVNFFALLILFFGRRKSRQLNRFLSNLGFSDIIFAIFNIPFTYITLIYNTWWLPEFLCPLTNFVQVLAPTVAFYTLIAIGIGRYFVIVTGHESRLLTRSNYTCVVIGSIWAFSVLLASPTLFAARISPVSYGNETYVECTEDWSFLNEDGQTIGTLYTVVVFVLTFILPVIALTYLYGHIGIIVYKHQLPVGNDNRVTNQNLTQTKIKVVKMLLLLVISFIICWTPSQIFYLFLWVFEDIRQDTNTESSEGSSYSIFYYTLYFVFHWLSCSHTIINPFIYCFFSNNFQRSDLIAILSCNVGGSSRGRKSINQFPSSANYNFNPTNSINRRSSFQAKKPNESIVTLKCNQNSPNQQFDV